MLVNACERNQLVYQENYETMKCEMWLIVLNCAILLDFGHLSILV